MTTRRLAEVSNQIDHANRTIVTFNTKWDQMHYHYSNNCLKNIKGLVWHFNREKRESEEARDMVYITSSSYFNEDPQYMTCDADVK